VKTVKLHSKHFFLNVRGLTLIYLLLCVLTVFFSRTYFTETLEGGSVPGALPFLVFLTIPCAILVFLAISMVKLVRESVSKKTGGRFQIRLFLYFIVIVVFAAVPVTVITTQAIYVIVRYWRSIHLETALDGAEHLALEHYRLQLERCEALVNTQAARIETLMTGAGPHPEYPDMRPFITPEALFSAAGTRDVLAVQDFRWDGDFWVPGAFAGRPELELAMPPTAQSGFVPREIPRDQDLIRYIQTTTANGRSARTRIRVISWHLADRFDETVKTLDAEKLRYRQINNLGANLKVPLILYYGMFFFPTLLMTAIVAISFTRLISQPLMELTDATKRVAEGDFSVQILVRQGDEFGALIRAFNAMVRDLEKSRNALVKAEKISVWQSMAQQLAHEIKNPLTPIRLSAERVLRRWQNHPDRVGEILESSMMAVIQEVQGLSNMLTDFRNLSRPLASSGIWTALHPVIAGAVAAFLTPYPAVRFNMDYVDQEVEVRMESQYVSQILRNLIINAIDAMDEKGDIQFRTDLVRKQEGHYCRFSIRDTGKGIPAAEREQVFTPYFTTKNTGTGLGLPIVERIVTGHGGSIWLDSAEGAGTTFFIDFPLDGSLLPREHAAAASPEGAAAHGGEASV
jgi:nitrogen fixation/metabolism regulation signal transduction histidine kinase